MSMHHPGCPGAGRPLYDHVSGCTCASYASAEPIKATELAAEMMTPEQFVGSDHAMMRIERMAQALRAEQAAMAESPTALTSAERRRIRNPDLPELTGAQLITIYDFVDHHILRASGFCQCGVDLNAGNLGGNYRHHLEERLAIECQVATQVSGDTPVDTRSQMIRLAASGKSDDS